MSHYRYPLVLHLTSRLLGVYDKLRGVGAAPTAEDEQMALVEQARGLIMDVCNDHVSAAEAVIRNPELQASLVEKIKAECLELVEYVVAAKRFNLEINARSKDRVVSFGEKLSCQFMTVLLQDAVSPLLLFHVYTTKPHRGSRPNTSTCVMSYITTLPHS